MEDKNEEHKLQERVGYYKAKIDEKFKDYLKDFEKFINDEVIINHGDSLIQSYQSTGYNFANLSTFPMLSDQPTLFYGNYIQRTVHFAEILAIMEKEKIIEEEDVSFGVRATKVNGYWGDPEPKVSHLAGSNGKDIQTSEFVEGILIFNPNSSAQLLKIAIFLETRAVKYPNLPAQIQGSWEVPNNRVKPIDMLPILQPLEFQRAIANVFEHERGNLIILKQTSTFKEKGWRGYPLLVSPKLYSYLSEGEVLP